MCHPSKSVHKQRSSIKLLRSIPSRTILWTTLIQANLENKTGIGNSTFSHLRSGARALYFTVETFKNWNSGYEFVLAMCSKKNHASEFPQKWDQQVTFSEIVVLQISELQRHNR